MAVYKITCAVNGKVYVGQTVKSAGERFREHCNRSPSQSHRSAIHNAIKKYGEPNFKLEILADTTALEEMNRLEREYIAKFNSIVPNGYNLQPGGDNKTCHEETKAKIRNTLKGRPIKNRQNGAAKGRPVSAERRAMISRTMTGVPQPWKYKPVMAVETGVVYESINAAAAANGIDRVTVIGLAKSGKRGRCGLSFIYVPKK